MSKTPDFAPATGSERSEWLDALRGFALLGILLVNIEAFSGYAFRGLLSAAGAPASELMFSAFDAPLAWLAQALVQGKFYSLFSFLFGLGFALQMQRAQALGAGAVPMLRRRLFWLLVFGLAHALLLWFGDILTTYAVLGLGLLLFRSLSTRALLGWALIFLASPVLIYLLFLAIGMDDPLAGAPAKDPAQSPIGRAVAVMAGGSYLEAVQMHLQFYPMGWVRRALRLALPRIFGMFLLGVWAARVGLPAARSALRPLLRRWLRWGLGLGLPLNLIYAALGGSDTLLPASTAGLLVALFSTLGIPLLCLAYVGAFALYWPAGRGDGLLVAAGRTALSHYLGQSLICISLFYGFGLGLFGSVSYTLVLPIAVAVFLVLALLGRAWLRVWPQGPLEALWRCLSYGTEHRSGRAPALAPRVAGWEDKA